LLHALNIPINYVIVRFTSAGPGCGAQGCAGGSKKRDSLKSETLSLSCLEF
jgi:hypothetical protein